MLGVPMPGSGDNILRAVIACRPGSLTPDDVLAWCRDRLSSFKMPRSILLVESIPRTGRGKVDRERLARLEA